MKTVSTHKLSQSIMGYFSNQTALRQKKKSHSWTRIKAEGLFPTILTHLMPADAKVGFGLHWDQHRVLTIMEARRAQGFLDHEPIVGSATKQWKIIGNSVARSVSLAFGMSFREAWLSNPPDLVKKITSQPLVELLSEVPISGHEVRFGPKVVIASRRDFDRSSYMDWDEGNEVELGEVVEDIQAQPSSNHAFWEDNDDSQDVYETADEMHSRPGSSGGLSIEDPITILDSEDDSSDHESDEPLQRSYTPPGEPSQLSYTPPGEPRNHDLDGSTPSDVEEEAKEVNEKEIDEEPITTTLPFRMFSSRRSRFVILDSDSEESSGDEVPTGGLSMRKDPGFDAMEKQVKVWIDLDCLDD